MKAATPGGPARWAGLAGGLFGAAGVALAAYASHGASGDARRALHTAAAMAVAHGLLLVAWTPRSPRLGATAALAVIVGTLLFSGSLFATHAFGVSPGLAPVGGSLLIASWLLVALERARG